MGKLFIQANNLDLVIDIIQFIYNNQNCSKQEIAEYCGITLRQVDYYTNACKYLNLLDDANQLTDIAKDIFENSLSEVTERIYELIINDNYSGKIFSHMYIFPDEDINDYALSLAREQFPGYSESVYRRRSDNMVKWCKKVINHVNRK